MCQRVQCSVCNKPSYVGCGAHVEQVLRGVPPEERCKCREQRGQEPSGRSKSWLERLLG